MPSWQKSSFSGTGDDNNCVELASAFCWIHLRESDTPTTVLTTNRAALSALLATVKNGNGLTE
ncbi:DUF397 domain-containing protein [Streptomyces sp. V3I7]|uniref:DUF397 domain-containing protein n=1 Tax=Streptomyces sp. V3I7 TaxID=3042278 RepID=UPI0027D90B4E|nr:DUF397 domain-containing protein [Streptomyces sp. V3I7]